MLARLPWVAAAAAALLVVAPPVSATTPPTFSQGFEADTSGWVTYQTHTVTREPSGYASGYANGVASATGGYHARLGRGGCSTEQAGGGLTVYCDGPFTRWGGYNSAWIGGYSTQVDIYLDASYAQAHPDDYGGEIDCLTASDPATDPTCAGTRFDFSSAINDSSGNFLRDFVFNAGTGPDPSANVTCNGWIVAASTNAFRSGASPYNGGNSPQCIAASGWYTFKHTFYDDNGELKVRMEILPAGSPTPAATWTLSPGTAITDVGCNRYGWFANQEIQELAIDNSSMTGCGVVPAPPPPPFAISDFHYHACAAATCTTTDAASPAYTCTDAMVALSSCTVGGDEFVAGTSKRSYLVHITVANFSGAAMTALKIQGGVTTSLTRTKPTYRLFSNTCGGRVTIGSNKSGNVATLSGGSLADGSSCDLTVEVDGVQFGTSAGHDAALTGTWSASAKAGGTVYSGGPTGRLELHIY